MIKYEDLLEGLNMLWSGSGSGLCHEKPSHRGYRSLSSDGTKPSDGKTDLACDQRPQEFRKEKEQPLISFFTSSRVDLLQGISTEVHLLAVSI